VENHQKVKTLTQGGGSSKETPKH